MPTYDYMCEKCEHIVEIFHSMSDETERQCSECQSTMNKQIGYGYFIAGGIKPTLASHRESERTKKVKDPERAVKSRKREFGHDAVGDPGMQTDPRHVVKRGRTLGGQQKEVDKREFIKAAARDDRMVAECQKALKSRKK